MCIYNDELHAWEFLAASVPFDQRDLCNAEARSKMSPQLYSILTRHHGLCELICNYVAISGLLGANSEENVLVRDITVEHLDTVRIRGSHILDKYSLAFKIVSYLSGMYSNNIFSWNMQRQLVTKRVVDGRTVGKLNREILGQRLAQIPAGEILKCCVFRRIGCSLKGHTLLVKKETEHHYTFFDPNNGEHRGLNFERLCDHLDGQVNLFGSEVLFMQARDDLQYV